MEALDPCIKERDCNRGQLDEWIRPLPVEVQDLPRLMRRFSNRPANSLVFAEVAKLTVHLIKNILEDALTSRRFGHRTPLTCLVP